MSRIPTPATIEAAPEKSQPLLQGVQKQLRVVPNMFRAISNSPAALEGYLGLNSALAKGALEPQTRERIALAIAEFNACDYCLSAHTYLGKNLSKLSDAEISANRDGGSTDAKADAAVRFAVKVAETRGHPSEADLQAVKQAGYTDAQMMEMLLLVALNTLTNYVNETIKTEIAGAAGGCMTIPARRAP
jgi:uncharacterized peroxidase-related enzyme